MFVQDDLKHLPIISSNGDPTLPEDDPIPPFAYHYHCLLMSGVNHTLLEPVISCHNKTMIHNTFFQHFPLRPPYSVAISYYEDILHNDLNEILQQLVNSTAVTRVPALPSLQLCTSKRCLVWLFSRLDKVISPSPALDHLDGLLWTHFCSSTSSFFNRSLNWTLYPTRGLTSGEQGWTFIKCRRIVQKLKAIGEKILCLA